MSAFHTFAGATMTPTRAHDGVGQLLATRVLDRAGGPLAFVDLVRVPPGVTVGQHTHGDDEELYIVIDGLAEVTVDGDTRRVGPGDVIVNPPGGTHALRNDGPGELRFVVVDVRTEPPVHE